MRFSVIIPLYNKAPYVAKTIRSVLAQTCSDYELIVVDDGSKDNSAEIASQELEGCENCRILRQENAGVSEARNNAVIESRGEYLCFLDADDWWAPTFLEEMSNLIDEFPVAGIYGTNYTIMNESKRKTRVASVGVEESFVKGYINYCQVYAKTMYMPLWTGAVSMPRSVFNEMGGFPKGIKLGEDFLLWIRIALKYKVVFLNKPLSFYNQDVEATNRGVGKLHRPQDHMLWNLGFLEEEEKNNSDYKQLVDNLRTYSLLPYLLDKRYRNAAGMELEKVDWGKQPSKTKKIYHWPIWVLQVRQSFLYTGSKIKRLVK